MSDLNPQQNDDGSAPEDTEASSTNEEANQGISRRSFLKYTSLSALSLPFTTTTIVNGQPTDDGPNVAFIGTGNRGEAHVNKMASMGANCPCFCDVDENMQKPAGKKWPKAKAYQDYRRMYDEMEDEIDAVFITTPDHHHFPAAMLAMQRGIHVYCEKPLTWSPWEARKLQEVAEKNDIVTQMGNQGHASDPLRQVIGYIRGGAIGEIQEVHSWTDRPIWPQGIKRPDDTGSPPDHLDWNVWLGPAPERPYAKNVYHPFNWRGWYPFGTGALGDMACHVMDAMFWSLDPGAPESVELVEIDGHMPESFPIKSTVKWEFPAKGDRSAFTAYWYDGKPKYNHKPDKPEGIDEEQWKKVNSGNLYIGEKGILRIYGAYGDNHGFVSSELADAAGDPNPDLMPESSPGHHKEFILSVNGDRDRTFPKSNFNYASPMTETVLLGAVAQRAGKVGQPLKYDREEMVFTNDDEASQLLTRDYRDGWDVT